MSLRPRHSLTRGASVLAALVVAALLASAGLLLQETSPLAILKREAQTATVVTPNQAGAVLGGGTAVDQKTECVPGFNYRVIQKETQPQTQCIHVMDCGLGAPNTSIQNSNQTAIPTKCTTVTEVAGGKPATGDQNACREWKCQTQYCTVTSTTPQVVAGCTWVAGGGTNQKEQISAAETQKKVAQDALSAIDNGERLPPEVQNMLRQDSGLQKVLNDAFSERQAEVESAMSTLGQEAQKNAQMLNELGCFDAGATVDVNCRALMSQKDVIEKKWEDLTSQYKSLADNQKNLAPMNCVSGSPNCADLTIPTQDPRLNQSGVLQPQGRPDTFGPPGGGGVSAACQKCQQNRNDYSACMQCSGAGGGQGMPSMPKGGGSGGGSSGGGSGGGQQQQCQPQYFCNGNTLMYAQCYNQQPGNAQQIQQCPTGYACQNNACQPSAQYGYCADGRTPRTAPAQPQPAANTCTVGAWEDASNGCQTSWRCAPRGSGSGQPTAQLSCQPTAASSGTTINITYACANGATTASATGFSITSETTLSGTASATVQKPASGQTITYALTCTNTSVTPVLSASEQCTVRVATPTIVLVATPEKVSQAEADEEKRKSTIGWVTSGMQKCAISSPDFATWSEQQASNTSVAGAAVSPVIPPAGAQFNLACTTLGGTTATSSVRVISTP